MADGTMDDGRLEESRRALTESRAAQAADEPLLSMADQVIQDMRGQLAENNWAHRVSLAFQATRGAA